MKKKWKLYEEEHPVEAGTYMIAFDGYNDDEIAPDVMDYFKLGDELFYDIRSNQSILVMKNGFYEIFESDTGRLSAHEVIPTFWRELPEPPMGFRWEK